LREAKDEEDGGVEGFIKKESIHLVRPKE